MGRKVQFELNLKPTTKMRRHLAGLGDTSQGTKRTLIARRRILGHLAAFYDNGEHEITADISEEEQFHSEILRFAHVSILTNAPTGSKDLLYVDARQFDVEVWCYGMPARDFIARAVQQAKHPHAAGELIEGASPIQTARNIGDFPNV